MPDFVYQARRTELGARVDPLGAVLEAVSVTLTVAVERVVAVR